MSELMDDGIIKMPYEMAMSDELSRKQFYSRANSLLTELAELRAYKEAAEGQKHSHIIDWEYDDDPDDADARGDLVIHQLNGMEYQRGTKLYARPIPPQQADKPAVAVPDGWKLVPVEPTSLMCQAVTENMIVDVFVKGRMKSRGWSMEEILNHKRYMTMLAAAPSHSQQSAE